MLAKMKKWGEDYMYNRVFGVRGKKIVKCVCAWVIVIIATFLTPNISEAQPAPDWKLEASILEWVRQSDADVLTRRLQERLDNYVPDGIINWRDRTVDDRNGHVIPAELERLVRWDRRGPNEVFRNGFMPQETEQSDAAENLFVFTQENTPSIFVSTTRTQLRNGAPYVWTPRQLQGTVYQYEIFAPGGIDINHSLQGAQLYSNQEEVTFPGGIRPEYIRTARELQDGRLVRIWANGGFSSSELAGVEDPICGPNTEVRVWTGEEKKSSKKNMRSDSDNYNELMREGDPLKDENDDVCVAPADDYPVTLYKDGYFKGEKIALSDDIENLAYYDFDNIASSIKITDKVYGVALYKDKSFYGEEPLFYTPGDYNYFPEWWNDNVSSLRVLKGRVFSENNYKGEVEYLSMNNPKMKQLNDKVSSIELGPNVLAMKLYENFNYGGKSIELLPNERISDITASKGSFFNDRISSYQFAKLALYDQPDLKGNVKYIYDDVPNLSSEGISFNDVAMSLKVSPGISAVLLYKDVDFKGESLYVSSAKELKNLSPELQKQISSVKFYGHTIDEKDITHLRMGDFDVTFNSRKEPGKMHVKTNKPKGVETGVLQYNAESKLGWGVNDGRYDKPAMYHDEEGDEIIETYFTPNPDFQQIYYFTNYYKDGKIKEYIFRYDGHRGVVKVSETVSYALPNNLSIYFDFGYSDESVKLTVAIPNELETGVFGHDDKPTWGWGLNNNRYKNELPSSQVDREQAHMNWSIEECGKNKFDFTWYSTDGKTQKYEWNYDKGELTLINNKTSFEVDDFDVHFDPNLPGNMKVETNKPKDVETGVFEYNNKESRGWGVRGVGRYVFELPTSDVTDTAAHTTWELDESDEQLFTMINHYQGPTTFDSNERRYLFKYNKKNGGLSRYSIEGVFLGEKHGVAGETFWSQNIKVIPDQDYKLTFKTTGLGVTVTEDDGKYLVYRDSLNHAEETVFFRPTTNQIHLQFFGSGIVREAQYKLQEKE